MTYWLQGSFYSVQSYSLFLQTKKPNKKIKSKQEIFFMPNCVYERSLPDAKFQPWTYKIVLMGVLKDGRKATVIIDGVEPYFEINLNTEDEDEAVKQADKIIEKLEIFLDNYVDEEEAKDKDKTL